jgi:hypothetical protein
MPNPIPHARFLRDEFDALVARCLSVMGSPLPAETLHLMQSCFYGGALTVMNQLMDANSEAEAGEVMRAASEDLAAIRGELREYHARDRDARQTRTH